MKRTPLKRKTPLRSRPLIKDWHEAQAKKEREGKCRLCGYSGRLENAHVIERKYSDLRGKGNSFRMVPEDAVVPLCPEHHKAYDSRQISLIGHLTLAEYKYALKVCKKWGLDCRRRLSGGRS